MIYVKLIKLELSNLVCRLIMIYCINEIANQRFSVVPYFE